MSQGLETPAEPFVDRRGGNGSNEAVRERRQFADSRDGLSPEARDLAEAIDRYKLSNRRRFITYEEMLACIKSLGYRR